MPRPTNHPLLSQYSATCQSSNGGSPLGRPPVPDGAVLATFTTEDLVPDSLDGEMAVLAYGAGFLDDGRVLVTVKVEDGSERSFVEWAVPVVIDLASGTSEAVAAPAPSQGQGPVALGDGTWVAVDPRPEGSDAPLVRRRFSTDTGVSASDRL